MQTKLDLILSTLNNYWANTATDSATDIWVK